MAQLELAFKAALTPRQMDARRLNGLRRRTHGLSADPMYSRWKMMLGRCYEARNIAYPSYGARGITVCARWRTSVADFVADMGPPPSDRHTLDRIEGTKGYWCGKCLECRSLDRRPNVRWANGVQQIRNRICVRTAAPGASISNGARRFAAWRLAEGAADHTLARIFMVHRNTFREWELGIKAPAPELLPLIEVVTGVPASSWDIVPDTMDDPERVSIRVGAWSDALDRFDLYATDDEQPTDESADYLAGVSRDSWLVPEDMRVRYGKAA